MEMPNLREYFPKYHIPKMSEDMIVLIVFNFTQWFYSKIQI